VPISCTACMAAEIRETEKHFRAIKVVLVINLVIGVHFMP
jgi:hypothetical protein